MKQRTKLFRVLSLTAILAVTASLTDLSFKSAGASSRDDEIARAVESLRSKLIETRRDFHQYPELSNREERTGRVLAEKLRALGVDEVRTGVARNGVVAVIKGKQPGPVVAVRADMDALPILETLNIQ
jgi:amidohydrolase